MPEELFSRRFGAHMLLTGVVIFTGVAGHAFGQDYAPPTWRGGPLTTYQQWDFSGGPGGGAPDVVPFDNPYGTPTWSVSGSAAWLPVSPVPPTPSAHPDVWALSNGATGQIAGNNVPDRDFFDVPTGCKLADIGITYFGTPPTVSVNPVAGGGDFTTTLDDTVTIPLADGWTFTRYDFTLFARATPTAEDADISAPAGGTTFLDSVVFDTQIVPEPGSAMILMALGGLLTTRRRSAGATSL